MGFPFPAKTCCYRYTSAAMLWTMWMACDPWRMKQKQRLTYGFWLRGGCILLVGTLLAYVASRQEPVLATALRKERVDSFSSPMLSTAIFLHVRSDTDTPIFKEIAPCMANVVLAANDTAIHVFHTATVDLKKLNIPVGVGRVTFHVTEESDWVAFIEGMLKKKRCFLQVSAEIEHRWGCMYVGSGYRENPYCHHKRINTYHPTALETSDVLFSRFVRSFHFVHVVVSTAFACSSHDTSWQCSPSDLFPLGQTCSRSHAQGDLLTGLCLRKWCHSMLKVVMITYYCMMGEYLRFSGSNCSKWKVFGRFGLLILMKPCETQVKKETQSWNWCPSFHIEPVSMTRDVFFFLHTRRRKFRSQTSDNMERWKSRGGKSMKSQGGEDKRWRRSKRQKVRREKMQVREKVGKSRFTVFFQWFGAPAGQKVTSLRRRVWSQLARLEMKKCTPLWGEAHFQVKSVKNPPSQTTLGSWDVEKVQAVVARSTFPSQKCKKLTGVRTTFWRSDDEKVQAVVARSTFGSPKCKKLRGIGPLFDVQMSKKCTLTLTNLTNLLTT